MIDRRSPSCLLLWVCRHAEIVSPSIDAARRNCDRVFCAAVVIAKFAVTDIAQNCSLIEARPRGNLRGFQELLNCDEGVDQADQFPARLVRKRSFELLACLPT